MEQTHWVMDIETISNCFLVAFEHYKKDEVHIFTISHLRNDLPKLIKFLEQNVLNNEWHISFNGLEFDSQIIQFIIKKRFLLARMNGETAARTIYKEAQDIIASTMAGEYVKYPEHKLLIRQLDVFKLNHWDNPAKSSGLKWIQCSMDWHNVQDMPLDHTKDITTMQELKMIADYCRNDVKSTKAIMHRNRKEIALRKDLSKEYNINLYSASEPKISKELFLHFLSEKTGIPKNKLRKQRTFRKQIIVKDILLPYLDFSIPEFKKVLEKFKTTVIDPEKTKGALKYEMNYQGVKTTFGLGGIHGAKRGIYEADEDMIIMTSDVVSYYPNLAIRNSWCPAHLPAKEFVEQYEWFFEERKKIPKSDPRNYVYKIILNSTFGLSIDKNSFLYDPQFGMQITINGQLSLLLLYEMLSQGIPGSIPIMQNTDGLEMFIPRRYKEKYLEICEQWETLTKLKLEHDEYQKMMVPDVNNYIAIYKYKEVSREDWLKAQKDNPDYLFKREDGKFFIAKTKCKGRFDFQDLQLHKNKSFLVVSKALYFFFVHGISIEEYIQNNHNIYEFCGQVKAKGNWTFKQFFVKNGVITNEEIQKTLRYYVGLDGIKIAKCHKSDGRQIQVESGRWMQTIFNKFEDKPFEDYHIDYRYYLYQATKEIKLMQPENFNHQLQLTF
jgi:hypothetical protein